MNQKYSSLPDTIKHIKRVEELLKLPLKDLITRSLEHDKSKTEEPEISMFDEWTPKLKATTYGSEEYKEMLKGMNIGLQHHYAHNRHHPEHFENGINDMTLVDLIEMVADWKAATERHADGNLQKSFEIQKERFGISDQLLQILKNTADKYF